MALRQKFRAFDTTIVFRGENIFGEAAKADAFAYMAKNEIERIDRDNANVVGRKIPHRTYVDGSKTDNLFSAKSTSRIDARWDLGAEVVEWIYDLLVKVAPYRSASKSLPNIHYRESFRVYADGREVSSPEEAIGAREVMILSIVPYARKIERGLKGYAPGAVFETVAALAKGRFGNIATIKFSYAEPEGPAGPLDAWASENAAKEQTARKQLIKTAKNRRQPAIVIYF